MSQKKVDQYKKEKANRQQIMKREKMMTRLGVTASALVLALLIGWFGFSVYKNVKANEQANTPVNTTVIDTSDVDAYVQDIATSLDAQ
ncbi:MAG: hypothetical protein MJ116_05010 [Lachnospiraceae bacterium]|nr:hypothetical protein [Lachnospiraceae bacterium]